MSEDLDEEADMKDEKYNEILKLNSKVITEELKNGKTVKSRFYISLENQVFDFAFMNEKLYKSLSIE